MGNILDCEACLLRAVRARVVKEWKQMESLLTKKSISFKIKVAQINVGK